MGYRCGLIKTGGRHDKKRFQKMVHHRRQPGTGPAAVGWLCRATDHRCAFVAGGDLPRWAAVRGRSGVGITEGHAGGGKFAVLPAGED